MTPTQCKMARVGLAWSAEQLSEKCGVSRVTIARFESGQPVAAASVNAIAAALNGAGADFTRRSGKVGVAVPSAD
ncbi:MAG: helix-turn-helix transcriptional regulator [Sphingopyxis terrae]|nr:helix-turn-helix transcriptional regulator [Sphingopyxis terrae]